MLFKRKKQIFNILRFLTFLVLMNFFLIRKEEKFKSSSSRIFNEKNIQPNQSINQNLFCSLPKLNFLGHEKNGIKKPCQIEQEWGFLKNSKWTYNKSIIDNFFYLNCSYRYITLINDTHNFYSLPNPLLDGTVILDDLIIVNCIAWGNRFFSTKTYQNIHKQIVDKVQTKKQLNIKSINGSKPLNILLLSFDSLSRVSWVLRMPKTVDFLVNTLKVTILKGHTIVGDGTFNNLTPMYTGKFPHELPSAHKNDPNGKPVDEVFPLIWKDLRQKGYVSYHFEDNPKFSPFSFHHRGFSNKSSDFHMRSYNLAVYSDKIWKKSDDLCIGSKKRSKNALDLLTDFIEIYRQKANFIAVMHYGENTHGDNTNANLLDDDLFSFLKQNFENGNLDQTALFLLSDHGVRYENERLSDQGDLEERLPFCSIYLPKSFVSENQIKIANLKKNSNQYSTPFDIYQTIRDLTGLNENNPESKNIRSMSLLDVIPEYRTCEHIGASLHYCTCLSKWNYLEKTHYLYHKAAKHVLNEINLSIYKLYDICSYLLLKEIKYVKYSLLKSQKIVRVKLVTLPNDAIYEATIIYDKSGKYHLDPISSVSRIDGYGAQSYCVKPTSGQLNITTDLRKFCYCRKPFFTFLIRIINYFFK